MKAFFDRTEPFFLTEEGGFDGVPVEIPDGFLNRIESRKATDLLMQEAIVNSGAPEDSAQNLADLYVSLIDAEIKDNG